MTAADSAGVERALSLLQRQVADMARRAVQVPVKRFGTVTTAGDPPMVTIDGDSAASPVANATGLTLPVGARVVLDFYPPHGVLITGILGTTALEQAWVADTLSVPDSTVASTAFTGWTAQVGRDWNSDGTGGLVCVTPGWWSMSMAGGFASNSGGTVRAIGLRSSGSATDLNASSPPAANTSGFGLSMGAEAVEPFTHDDVLTAVARQDSGGALDASLRLHLRWVAPL